MKRVIARGWGYVRSNPKKFFLFVLSGMFLSWFLFDDYGIVKRVAMELEHSRLLEERELLGQRIEDNERRILHAHDPDSLEMAARERYNFRKEGEILFIIREQ